MIKSLPPHVNKFYLENPDIFAEQFFKVAGEPFKLYDYQRDVFTSLNSNRFVIMAWARQTGKTLTESGIANTWALINDDFNIPITAPRQRHSNRIIHRCKRLLTTSKYWDDILCHMTSEADPDLSWSRTSIEFTNGSVITALPEGDEGTAYLGEATNLGIADECARFKDIDNFVSSVMKPSVFATNGKILLASSSWGRVGRGLGWCNIVESGEYLKCQINSYEALEMQKKYISENDYKTKKDFLNLEERRNPVTFRMQYLNSFEGGIDTPFDYNKVTEMFDKRPYEYVGDIAYRKIAFSIDWGKSLRTGDKSVLSVCDVTDPDNLHILEIVSWQEPYTRVTEKVMRYAEKYVPALVLCDIGSGENQLEILTKNFKGKSTRVEGVFFSSSALSDTVRVEHGVIRKVVSKNMAVESLGHYIDTGRIKVHMEHHEAQQQLLDYIKEITPAGNIRYGHLPNGHDDIVDTFIMLANAMRSKYKIEGSRLPQQLIEKIKPQKAWGKKGEVWSPI